MSVRWLTECKDSTALLTDKSEADEICVEVIKAQLHETNRQTDIDPNSYLSNKTFD